MEVCRKINLANIKLSVFQMINDISFRHNICLVIALSMTWVLETFIRNSSLLIKEIMKIQNAQLDSEDRQTSFFFEAAALEASTPSLACPSRSARSRDCFNLA